MLANAYLCKAEVACRLVARLADASRKAEEYAALGMFQEAAETAATVSPHSWPSIAIVSVHLSLVIHMHLTPAAAMPDFAPGRHSHVHLMWFGIPPNEPLDHELGSSVWHFLRVVSIYVSSA